MSEKEYDTVICTRCGEEFDVDKGKIDMLLKLFDLTMLQEKKQKQQDVEIKKLQEQNITFLEHHEKVVKRLEKELQAKHDRLKEAEKVIENISLDDTTKCLDQLVDCDTCIYTDRAFKANCNDNGCKTEYARNYFKNKEEKQ